MKTWNSKDISNLNEFLKIEKKTTGAVVIEEGKDV